MTSFTITPYVAPPRPAFGLAAQHQPPRHSAKARAREHREARMAAAVVPQLPAPGESVHTLMLGRFDLCQVIEAAVALKHPVRHLRLASLCFSAKNTALLLRLLDSGRVQRLSLLVSEFFKAHNPDLYETFAADLAGRPGSRLAADRNHAKVTLFDHADGDALVFEGSANLRTNRNREHLTVIRDRPLHDWHAAWIDRVVSHP